MGYHQLRFIPSICAVLACLTIVLADTTEPFSRFEYKVSFKGPFLSQKDGTIPFWEYGGHAIAGDSYIRLTPSMSDKKGHVWSKKVADFSNFRVDVAIRVSGVGRHGGDGLGIWFVDEKPDYNLDKPDVFGGRNNWTGLAVLLDTYDNDGKRDNPKIGGFVSANRQLTWNHNSDGLGQDVGHCVRDYRNRPFPVRLRLQYLHRRLTLSVNNGIATEDSDADYESCFERADVDLPAKGYFGVTAATGGVSDDMDVYSFVVHSLADKAAAGGDSKAAEADRRKFEQEYEEYSKKLREQIDAIAKSHREASEGQHKTATEEAGGGSGGTEDEAVRQYRQIWEEQSRIRAQVHDVSAAVATTRQELAASLAEVAQSLEAARRELAAVKAAMPASGTGAGGDASGLRDLRDGVTKLADKVDHLANRHSELADRVGRSVQQQQQQAESAAAASGGSGACATTYSVYWAMLLQTGALCCLGIVYLRKQNAAKKFY